MSELRLDYVSHQSTVKFEEFDGGARLTFPPPSRRMQILVLSIHVFFAIGATCELAWGYWQWRSFQRQIAGLSPIAQQGLAYHGPFFQSILMAMMFWTFAILTLRKMRKGPPQSEVWEATANELTLWRSDQFDIHKIVHHPVGIRSVKVLPIRDVFGRKDMVYFTIRFNNDARTIRRRLAGADSITAEEAAKAFRKILNLSEDE